MKKLKNSREYAGQSAPLKAKPQKHEANVRKNSTIYFQVGLILCLLITYGLLEMRFEDKDYQLATIDYVDYDVEYTPENFTVEKQKVEETIDNTVKKIVLTKDPIVKSDDYQEPISEILTEPEPDVIPIDADNIVLATAPDEVDENEIFNMNGVEQVPIYPGCESSLTNEERKACMSEKLGLLIRNTFDTNIAGDLGLSGKQKIYVQFKIDKSGRVTEIISRAPKQQLEVETKRVLSKVPQMIPGKQRFKPVAVMYTMPIIFDVQ